MKLKTFYNQYNVIILVVLSSTFVIGNAVYTCTNGQKQCYLSSWSQWSNCTSSCGGGTSRRFKPLCCDTTYTSIGKCATDCNITTKDYVEDKVCGHTCVNGVFRQNKCQCPKQFTGKCCESDACEQGCTFGECKNGKCSCMAFFKGDSCQKPEPWFLVAASVLGTILMMMISCCDCRFCCGYGRKTEPEQTDNSVQ
ncbi:thrombospondin-1-like [Mytilus edulis]|uniref:thrombospondin-1-like n=1 Tax=Mytilus edulis TaxID=6550 RepID=UPI0039F08F82